MFAAGSTKIASVYMRLVFYLLFIFPILCVFVWVCQCVWQIA